VRGFAIALLLIIPRAGLTQAPMFRGNPSHTGVYDSSATGEFGGLRWRFATGGPVRSSPAVAGGVVYVGSSDGNLYAVDARTGNLKWKFDARSGITSSPAVAGGTVVVGTRDGRWIACDAGTGSARWTVTTGPDLPFPWGYESGDRYTSSAVVVGQQVLVGSGDGSLRSLDLASGKESWRAQAAGRIRSSPAVAGDLVVVGDADGVVYAFDRATGAAKWKHETEGHTLHSGDFGYDRRTIQSSPAIMGERVFVGARDGFLYALSLATGQRVWRFDHQISWVNSSPAVAGGLVYAASSDGQFAQAVDAASGSETWRVTTALVWSSPSISGNTVFVGDAAGRLHAIERTSGKVRWTWRGGGGIFSSPAISSGTVYVGSDDGSLYALDASASRKLARAVYWDSAYVRATTIPGQLAIRDWFRDHDYELLDATGLAAFLRQRISDHAPSVVVLASDHLPPGVAGVAADSVPLRRYLDAGGRIVDPGIVPLLWPRDSATGDRDLGKVNRKAPRALLGVSFEQGQFDPNGTSVITAAGQKLGMTGGWMSTWSADPPTVSDILSTDEMGLASAWVKRYAGGGAFLRIPAIGVLNGGVNNLVVLQAAAEMGRMGG
jgi:outer membrane protein assembly factor BamB